MDRRNHYVDEVWKRVNLLKRPKVNNSKFKKHKTYVHGINHPQNVDKRETPKRKVREMLQKVSHVCKNFAMN